MPCSVIVSSAVWPIIIPSGKVCLFEATRAFSLRAHALPFSHTSNGCPTTLNETLGQQMLVFLRELLELAIERVVY